MVRLFKVVALALMLVMGTLPLFASTSPSCLAMARQTAAPSMHACCPSMAITGETATSLLSLRAHGTAPCCRIVPAKPVRVVDLQMPAASAELALQPANETVSAVPATMHARCDHHLPLPDSARSQSHLCTFLI